MGILSGSETGQSNGEFDPFSASSDNEYDSDEDLSNVKINISGS